MSKKVNKACRNPADASESDYASDTSSEEQKSSQDVSKHLDTKLLSKRKRGNIDEDKYWCPECKCKDFRPDNLKRHIKKSHKELFNAWPNYTVKDWVSYCSQMSLQRLEQDQVSEDRLTTFLGSGNPTPEKRTHPSPAQRTSLSLEFEQLLKSCTEGASQGHS